MIDTTDYEYARGRDRTNEEKPINLTGQYIKDVTLHYDGIEASYIDAPAIDMQQHAHALLLHHIGVASSTWI